MSEPKSDVPKAPAVAAAIAILRHLASQSTPVGLTAISRAVGLSPSSCLNILRTLAADAFVFFDPDTKDYTLGLGSIALARRALDPAGAMDIARSDLRRMALEHEVTSSLWRLAPNERLVLVGFEESLATTRVHLTIGQRLPQYLGAMGRCIAAYSNIEGAEFIPHYEALRWHRDPGLTAYRAQAAEVRARGWAIDIDNFMQGVTTLAAPVLDRAGNVRFCVTSTTFSGQNDDAGLNRIGTETARLSHVLSTLLFGAEI
ncbi:IclR family transcriptional regulator C-terminal domain-containing protein [Brevundimonas sp.]|uniref:IclR family transcriptional regulator n=1 Tax=Brevundimonas sp. TaxID=1871086 RepID=UPI0028A0D8C8|nr:IclR family transcriptional regulator C-terminal domain-containing protein [Brevundimonas sp.]